MRVSSPVSYKYFKMDFGHGNIESSKYSRTEIEESDGNGSIEGSGSSKHSDTYPEVINRSGGTESNHFEINPEIIMGWGNNNNFDGRGSSEQSEVIQEEIDMIEGDILVSTKKVRLSSSSSSSDSSTDDQFRMDMKLSKSRSGITSTSSPKPDDNTQQSLKDKHHVSGNSTSKLEEYQNGSAGPTSTSQAHESTVTQSPPIQVMDRLGEFDPYRIPSAVFARSKSTTPADWSIASNDSLFSIQVGSSSFSRDHILNLKSGELFKSSEFIAFSPSPVALSADTDKNGVELDKSEVTLVSDDALKDKTAPGAEEPIGQKPTHPVASSNSSISNHSDYSVTSVQSFAFPILRDGKNVSKKEKEEQQQQQEQPLASAKPSKSACCNCCSWFPSCRWRWRWRCHWHWHWHWHCCRCRCCCCKCCRGNCC